MRHSPKTPSGVVLARDLSPPLADLLGCDNVWCDSRTEESSQKFVLWAGCILERRQAPPAACLLLSPRGLHAQP